MRVEHIPTTAGRRGTEGMTIVHDRRSMESLYARDALGLDVPSMPRTADPASVTARCDASDLRPLVDELSRRWSDALAWAQAAPSRAGLMHAFWETGDLEPLRRAIPRSLTTTGVVEARIDTRERDAWIAGVPVPSPRLSGSSDARLDARAAARRRGLSTLLVLPIAEAWVAAGPHGLIVSDRIYEDDGQMTLALERFSPRAPSAV